MANKERNKRSARKARAAEREAKAAAQAQSQDSTAKPVKAEEKKEKVVKKDGVFSRIKNYLHDVKVEMQRVTWPDRPELVSYSVAVVCMLIVFGVVTWAVDSGLVTLLLAYTGLRG